MRYSSKYVTKFPVSVRREVKDSLLHELQIYYDALLVISLPVVFNRHSWHPDVLQVTAVFWFHQYYLLTQWMSFVNYNYANTWFTHTERQRTISVSCG